MARSRPGGLASGWGDVNDRAGVGTTSALELPAGVTFRLDIGPGLPLGAGAQKKEVADSYLVALPQCATWVWTDGSAKGGVTNGGAGALIEFPDGETAELREAAGRLCSSYRAEMVALRAALTHLRDHPAHDEDPVVLCTDSQTALAKLRRGPPGQEAQIGAEIWRLLAGLASADRPFILLWVPSHCGLPGNERADTLAGQAFALPQDDVPVDARTVHRAAARVARSHAIAHWPPGWYRSLTAGRLPPPVRRFERETAVDIHQIRAGHWSGSTAYLHRIGRSPGPDCDQCAEPRCRASWCRVCGEEPDSPEHILRRCPALMTVRFRLFGTIFPSYEDVRRDDAVAALVAVTRFLQSRQTTTH